MPTIPRKPDSDQIVAFLEDLKKQEWVRRSERSWWPQYVFHFTPLENAVQILTDGELRCRHILETSGVTFRDAASPEIIARTRDDVKNSVRLYFRPRTPTQYRMEGIRPQHEITLGAHCPIPVFFLFRAADVLTRLDCQFTDGNSASEHVQHGHDATFLENLPFEKIYHNKALGSDEAEKRTVVFHRNAEVIIPERLDLSVLSFLACRSPAEKETFLSRLPQSIKNRYQDRIRVAPMQLYFKRWTFIEQVTLEKERITVLFSPDSLTPGPFLASFELYNLETGKRDIRQIPNFDLRTEEKNPFEIELTLKPSHYRFRITLDDNLAYENEFHELFLY